MKNHALLRAELGGGGLLVYVGLVQNHALHRAELGGDEHERTFRAEQYWASPQESATRVCRELGEAPNTVRHDCCFVTLHDF